MTSYFWGSFFPGPYSHRRVRDVLREMAPKPVSPHRFMYRYYIGRTQIEHILSINGVYSTVTQWMQTTRTGLILTYTEAMANALKSFIDVRDLVRADKVTIVHIEKFLLTILGLYYQPPRFIEAKRADHLLAQAIHSVWAKRSGSLPSLAFFRHEIQIMKANALNPAQYLQTPHSQIPRRMRMTICKVYEQYCALLESDDIFEKLDLPLLTLQHLARHPMRAALYDQIIVCEAHFFTAAQLGVVEQLLR